MELTELEQRAVKYFGLTFAESDEPGAGWFCYAPMPEYVLHNYPGSSCECVDDVVRWYLRTAANAEIERLKKENEELRSMYTTNQPPYSAAQLELFHKSCYVPPPQVIPWHHLPELPEQDINGDDVWVHGCAVRKCKGGGNYECGDDVLYIHSRGYWQDELGETVNVRAWHYLEDSAPPKPLGEVVEAATNG